MKNLNKYQTVGQFENAYYGSDYVKPWVSLTTEGVPKDAKLWCEGTQHYYGMRYVGKENTEYGLYYKWASFYIDDTPGVPYYWTASRKPNNGDPVYWSVEGGISEHDPCGYFDSTIEYGPSVDYNKPMVG